MMRAVSKWIRWSLLALLLLVATFYRPIFFHVTRYFILRTAEQQHLTISYTLGGSIFTSLRISNLSARPTEPGPIDHLKIKDLDLNYSLWGLLRKGWPGFLTSIALHDGEVILDKSQTASKGEKKTGFKLPALIPQKLSIENLDLRVRQKGEDLVLHDMDILLQPDTKGWLRIAMLQIPGVHTWSGINATASYDNRTLALKHLGLGPEVQIHEVELDMSQLSSGGVAVRLNASLFGGPTTISASVNDLHTSENIKLSLTSQDNSLAEFSDYFHLEPALTGIVRQANIFLKGTAMRPKTWNGHAQIEMENVASADRFAPMDLQARLELTDGKARVKELTLDQQGNDISVTATADLPKTLSEFHNLTARGSLQAQLNDLNALVKSAEGAVNARGSFSIVNGEAHVDLTAERGGNQVKIEAQTAVPDRWSKFDPGKVDAVVDIDTPDLKQFVANKTGTKLSGKLSVKGRLEQHNGKISGAIGVSGADVRYGKLHIDSLGAALLIEDQVANLERLRIQFHDGGNVTGFGAYGLTATHELATKLRGTIELGQLPFYPKQELRGKVSARLEASGTLEDPRGSLKIAADSVHAAVLKKVGAVNANLEADLAERRLTFDATLRSQRLKPLRMSGNMPLDVARLVRNRTIDRDAPLDFSLTLPPSSIAFVTDLVPQIRYAEGTIGLQAQLRGTVREPALSGSVDVQLPALRLRSTAFPKISSGEIKLTLHGRRIAIERARMRIAGGPLDVSGTVQLDELTKPLLDLRLRGKSILLARGESMNVRANADLSISGPLAAAHVAGSLGLTQSRFLKDIEIIPIGLPGRPAPDSGIPQQDTAFSVKTPPLSNWIFDVVIKTADPVKVRGNLAHGKVLADLHLSGTGSHPLLQGSAKVRDFAISLPFTRLELTRGSAYFSPETAILNPKIDLNGVTEMRDYRINVYVHGTAAQPKTIFSSEPPLPQEDIIALLATGATRDELMANGGRGVAGRAAWIALKQLYHQLFGGESEPPKNDFQGRFEFDLGGIDPKTGTQSFISRYRISKHWMLVGSTSVGGGLEGKLKYIIRFR